MLRFSARSPAIVGHRGAPREACENSRAAFLAAFDAGAEWVELDARRTADDGVVVVHDPCTVEGRPVVDCSLAELTREGLASLEELLRDLPPRLGLDVELKNLPTEPDYDEGQGLAALLAQLLVDHVGTRPLLVSSFNPLALNVVREHLPEVPLGLLTVPTLPLSSGMELAVEFGVDAIFPHVTAPDLSETVIGDAHEWGLAVMVWTVDDPEEAIRLARAGVDALCTNDPAGLIAAVHSP